MQKSDTFIPNRVARRGQTFAFFLSLAAMACLPACIPTEAPRDLRIHQPKPKQQLTVPKNLLLIVLDTAAAKHFKLWGYPRETTPFLSEFAKQGHVFLNAHSQAPSTLPSTWSYTLGLYPLPPPRGRMYLSLRIRRSDYTIADAFKNSGFATAGFSENPFITPDTGFGKGFDVFETFNAVTPSSTWNKIDQGRNPQATENLFRRAEEWIDSVDESPWFCYLHVLRPHSPYISPDRFMRAFYNAPRVDLIGAQPDGEPSMRKELMDLTVDQYDGNLAYADDFVSQIVSKLKANGILDDTVVVITSDHGEAFMEHGAQGHGRLLFEELLHVPLIIVAPEAIGFVQGSTDTLIELIDLFPTFVEMFRLDLKGTMHGRSLVPDLLGRKISGDRYLIAQNMRARQLSVRKNDLKIIFNLSPDRRTFTPYALFNIAQDPYEQTNLLDQNIAFDDLYAMGTKYIAAWVVGKPYKFLPRKIAQERLKEIKALGYLK